MRALLLASILIVDCCGGAAWAADSDAVLGVWETAGDDRAHVQFYREGERVDGRIVRLLQPLFPDDDPTHPGQAKVDRENPDPALRDRPVIGMILAHSFEFDGERWEGGRIYDPESGRTYKCWMRIEDDGRLKVRGYIGFSLLGRTEYWTRVEDGEG